MKWCWYALGKPMLLFQRRHMGLWNRTELLAEAEDNASVRLQQCSYMTMDLLKCG